MNGNDSSYLRMNGDDYRRITLFWTKIDLIFANAIIQRLHHSYKMVKVLFGEIEKSLQNNLNDV